MRLPIPDVAPHADVPEHRGMVPVRRGETARGLNPDSAISWAASSPGETFQREAERIRLSRYGPGTKLGTPEP